MNWQTTGYITYQQSGRSALCTAIPKSLTRADGISGLLSQAEAISKYPQFSTTHWTQSPNVHLAAQRAVRSVMRSDDEDKTLLMILELAGLNLDSLVQKGGEKDKEDRQYDVSDGAATLTREISHRWKQRRYEVDFRVDGD